MVQDKPVPSCRANSQEEFSKQCVGRSPFTGTLTDPFMDQT